MYYDNTINNSNKLKNKNTKKTKSQLNLEVDPLFVEGTKKYEFNFSFNTEFANLLAFLRELEFQDNVILIEDIKIKSTSQDSNNREIDDLKESLQVLMSIVFYGRI